MIFATLLIVFFVTVRASPELNVDVVAGLRNCGAGPVTSFFANLVSIPCDHSNIDNCCYEHDRCYESPFMTQEECDSQFCGCLDSIPSNFYCGAVAQPSLCLATRVFGHNFHWSNQVECSDHGEAGDEENSTSLKGNCVLSGSLEEYENQHPFASI